MNHDNPIFSAGDVAAILGEPEAAVRRWHHTGFARHFGRKAGYNVVYSCRDIAGFKVARDLVVLGFPPPLAARVGAIAVFAEPKPDAVLRGRPDQIASIAPPSGSGIAMDRCVWRVPAATSAKIEIPIGRIWSDVVAKTEGRAGHG